MKKIVLFGLVFWTALASSFATTYYIDFDLGLDSRNGTSKATAWKRCPNMTNWSGTYTPAHGDRFIFKGGVTWTASFPWNITSGGTAPSGPYPTDVSTYNYYGVDQTWFTGGSWTRPLFDFQNQQPTVGIRISVNYVVIDNIEMKAFKGSGSPSSPAFLIDCSPPGGYVSVSNCLLHDCPPSVSTTDNAPLFVMAGFSPAAPGIDVVGTEIHQQNVDKSGIACRNTTTVRNCHIHHIPNAVLGFGTVSGCHIHNIGPATAHQPNGDVVHANAIETFSGAATITGNLIHDLDSTATPLSIGGGISDFNGASGTVYNNVFYNTGGQTVGNDSRGAGGANFLKVYNNTFVGVSSVVCDTGTVTCEVKNNHFIDTPVSIKSGVGTVNGASPGSFAISALNIVETTAQALSAGYTQANNYSPQNGSAPTVDVGVNLAAVFSSDILNIHRPQGSAYDDGAYEWNGSPAPTPVPTATATPTTTPIPLFFIQYFP